LSHTLTAKEQSLAKIFSDDYVFTIPGYQRPYAWGEEQAEEWRPTIILSAVLPHEGMLPAGWLSFRPFLYFFISMVGGCGHVVEGCGGGQREPRSGALSTAAAGAPQAHRPHVHSLPGA